MPLFYHYYTDIIIVLLCKSVCYHRDNPLGTAAAQGIDKKDYLFTVIHILFLNQRYPVIAFSAFFTSSSLEKVSLFK